MTGLLQLFADDIALWSDGGGQAKAALNVIHGKDKVARFFVGIANKMPEGLRGEERMINGFPGYVFFEGDDVHMTASFDVADGKIVSIQLVRNPEKLVCFKPH